MDNKKSVLMLGQPPKEITVGSLSLSHVMRSTVSAFSGCAQPNHPLHRALLTSCTFSSRLGTHTCALELLVYYLLMTTSPVHLGSNILSILYLFYLHLASIDMAPNPPVIGNRCLSYSPILFPSFHHPTPLTGSLV